MTYLTTLAVATLNHVHLSFNYIKRISHHYNSGNIAVHIFFYQVVVQSKINIEILILLITKYKICFNFF